jgi:hypothetical protein
MLCALHRSSSIVVPYNMKNIEKTIAHEYLVACCYLSTHRRLASYSPYHEVACFW